MQNSVHDRLRKLIDDLGLNLKDFSDKSGVPYRTLQDYIAGKSMPGGDNLQKISTKFSASIDWLLTGKGSVFLLETKRPSFSVKEQEVEYGEYVFVPRVAGAISAGGGLVPDNTIELKIAFRRDWIERRGDPKAMSLIRVSGDSMEPTLQSGDLALVDHGRNYIDPQGGIYAIAIDQTIMIKRLQIMHPTKKIKVISDNGKYETVETDLEQLRINGRVIWFGREIER